MLFRFIKNLRKIDRLGKYKEKNTINDVQTKKQISSNRQTACLWAPMSRAGRNLTGKVSFCTSKLLRKASLAVETAMVLPLFFLGTVTILSFMDVYKLETEKLMGLCEKTKEAGMYAYVLDGSGPEEITLPEFYAYEPIGGIVPVSRVWLHNTVKVHAWTGKTYSAEEKAAAAEAGDMVWVAENGEVFHREASCSYVSLTIMQTKGSSVGSRTNAYGEHYYACETCSHNQAPGATVYVTLYGNSYHNLETCSSLKRTIRLVTEDQVEDLRPCSRCG
ncbi:MAG: hypothetical protein KBT01_00575 [Clostridiales bacterium]|nr:hypothetical protein [Candidatus Blautia equi]